MESNQSQNEKNIQREIPSSFPNAKSNLRMLNALSAPSLRPKISFFTFASVIDE